MAQHARGAAERRHALRESRRESARAALAKAERDQQAWLSEANRACASLSTSRSALEALFQQWPTHRVREARGRLAKLRENVAAREGELTARQRDLRTHRESGRCTDVRSELEAALGQHAAVVSELESALASLRVTEGVQEAKLAALETLQNEREGLRQAATPWLELGALIGSSDGKKLRTFAQGLTLDQLVSRANQHLESLAKRFQLRRVGDLDLAVVDRDNAGEERAVHTLSGGETFLVSLAMALALSSLFDDRVKTRSLFIDEGFGSLDPDTLDVALAALEALHAHGRQVVLISHVQGLADRFDVAVRVRRRGPSESTIEVCGATDALPSTNWAGAAE